MTRICGKSNTHDAETPLVLDKSVAHNADHVLDRIVSHPLVRPTNSVTTRHMAIYGAGSNWSGEDVQDDFFLTDRITIGWNRGAASDVQATLASLKMGDIVYLKSNRPGSRDIRVKGIGIVARSFLECIQAGEYPAGPITDWESFFIRVSWIIQDEFIITIPDGEGRMTNIRAATIYEEPLPFVQTAIIERIVRATGRQFLPLYEDDGPTPPRTLNLNGTNT